LVKYAGFVHLYSVWNYYKDTDNQLLNLIFYVKLCYIKH
jgi:hypothetical protein